MLVVQGLRLSMAPNSNSTNQKCLNANEWKSWCKTPMTRYIVAIFIIALVLFSISGAVYARVNLRVISVGDATTAQELLERMTSEPASIALFGMGLLAIAGFIRRRRSRSNAGSGKRSLDVVLEAGD
jgi:Mn2+/Fe2+ NRAMP family transporter